MLFIESILDKLTTNLFAFPDNFCEFNNLLFFNILVTDEAVFCILEPISQSRCSASESGWCGRRESNPRLQLGKLTCCHYTTPAICAYIIQIIFTNVQNKGIKNSALNALSFFAVSKTFCFPRIKLGNFLLFALLFLLFLCFGNFQFNFSGYLIIYRKQFFKKLISL